ncbi:glycosyltransferase DesVII/glycosyltransferase OleGII/desosaminyltransferase OleGI [Amycolatopsis marina]|uniref:Glycosyltransferase DesVII/glycosyltransferase OleGII/desosaminyltransferase OleGI n=2 Tax=Amycolatopsis marina TaxID=490629 RepID=A0A1I1BDM8_9PSEU|nr:glycosyltransferase DesVII/glycosyltransferase OleGII/desosaminyltransferase OleGI [Amycolatopsis marina]
MRVLCTTIAHSTHFHSMVPLAWALRCAGHEVRVASRPALTDTITGAGLTAVEVGKDDRLSGGRVGAAAPAAPATGASQVDFTALRAGEWDPHDLLGFYTMLVPSFFAGLNDDAMIDDLVEVARDWRPDLVIWEPLTWAGAIAARVSGAAHARLLWSADVLGLVRQQFLAELARVPAPERDDPMAEWLTWTLDRHGCEFDEEVVGGQLTIDQEPPAVRLPVRGRSLPMQYVPYNGPAVLPDWLRKSPSRPRVCLTLGVSARNGRGRTTVSFGDVLSALGDLHVEVVVTASGQERGALGEVPRNVRVVEFVPLHAVLPSCAAIVHHGGAGTWSTAIRAGVPQLIIPEIWDTGIKADLITEAGAGLCQPRPTMTPRSVREHLLRLLEEPSFAEAAARLRAEMLAQPTPAELVPRLERFVAEQRR